MFWVISSLVSELLPLNYSVVMTIAVWPWLAKSHFMLVRCANEMVDYPSSFMCIFKNSGKGKESAPYGFKVGSSGFRVEFFGVDLRRFRV